MNKSRRTGCKFLEAADRITVRVTATGARINSGGGEVQAVAVNTIWNCGRRPIVNSSTNTAEITGTEVPVPGSRKKRPLD